MSNVIGRHPDNDSHEGEPRADHARGLTLRLSNSYAKQVETIRYLPLDKQKDGVLLAARVLLMILFLLFGWQKLTGFSDTVAYMVSTGASLPTLSALIAVAMECVVGVLLVVGFVSRQSRAVCLSSCRRPPAGDVPGLPTTVQPQHAASRRPSQRHPEPPGKTTIVKRGKSYHVDRFTRRWKGADKPLVIFLALQFAGGDRFWFVDTVVDQQPNEHHAIANTIERSHHRRRTVSSAGRRL